MWSLLDHYMYWVGRGGEEEGEGWAMKSRVTSIATGTMENHMHTLAMHITE